jgi:hypothetical protein
MKKVLFFVLCALSVSACADDRPITFDQLPKKAQAILTQNANMADVMSVTADGYGPFADYDVTMNNMDKWEFDGSGDIDNVEMMSGNPVPAAIIPAPIAQVVAQRYPNLSIVKYSVDRDDYEVRLNNRVELKFTKSFQLIGMDYDD